MKSRFFFITTLLFIFLNCVSQAQNDTFPLSNKEALNQIDTIVIQLKEPTRFFNNESALRIAAIEQDHRCPIDVQCVWGGNAKIKFELSLQKTRKLYFVLNSNQRFTRDTIIEDMRINLIDLQPERKRSLSIADGKYRATVIINKVATNKPVIERVKTPNPFIGVWGKGSVPIIIGDAGNEGYHMFFGYGDAGFMKTDVNPDSIVGYNSSGNFKIKMISLAPPQFLYSDDGLGGHFEPAVDQLYEKYISNFAKMLVGKWQSIDDSKKVIEYTTYDLINFYDGQLVTKEPYTISNKCMNSAEISRNISYNHDYISVVNSDICWDIVSLDKDSLTISYMVTGNILKYKRVK